MSETERGTYTTIGRLISEEEHGGEVFDHDQETSFSYSLEELYGKKGDKTPVIRESKYEAVLTIPFTFTVKEEVHPPQRNGKDKRALREGREIDVSIHFPIDEGGIEGSVYLNVYVGKDETPHMAIFRTIGELALHAKYNDHVIERLRKQ